MPTTRRPTPAQRRGRGAARSSPARSRRRSWRRRLASSRSAPSSRPRPTACSGRSGLLSLPFAEEHGGGGQPYEVYLQVVEEIATAWPSVAVGTSVHSLTATVVDVNATKEQREEWLPKMLSGDWLGAYCLSEPQAGSDVSGIRTRARREGDEYVVSGTKQWISNGSCADYYILFARTGDDPRRGLSAFVVPADTEGMSFGPPEKKMGLACDVTTQVIFDNARIPAGHRIGDEGAGMRVALSALDAGRLGIAAVATGIAQAALAHAVAYAREREQFGKPIGEFQGLQFLLADLGAGVERARATYLHAARLKDAGPAVLTPGEHRQADRDRHRHAGDHRRGPGPGRQRLHPGVPGRAAVPRRQGHPDLRGHQPDPADGDRARPAALTPLLGVP